MIATADRDGRWRVCIAGAGAIGTTLATRLAVAGHDVSVVARGATRAAIEADGLTLTDREGTHHARVAAGSADELGPQDAVLICAKATDHATLARAVLPVVGEGTLVVPVVNGIPWWYFEGVPGRHAGSAVEAVDPGGRLKAEMPLDRIIGAVTYVTAERLGPGVARSTNPLRMVVGEIDHTVTDRVEALAAVLRSAGIATEVSARIRDPLWTKVIGNITSNPLSVLTGATLREIYTDPTLSHVARQLLDEALVTAAAHGARMDLDPDAFLAMGASMGDIRTSMLQDYDKGLPLELAAIGDAVAELAELKGLAMPRTRTILDLVRFRAAKSRAEADGPSSRKDVA